MASTANKDRSFLKYSETPPYVHCFRRLAKTAIHFLVKKTLVNTAKFFGPLVTVLTGFYCIKRTPTPFAAVSLNAYLLFTNQRVVLMNVALTWNQRLSSYLY